MSFMEEPIKLNRLEKVFLTSWRPYAWLIGIGFALYLQALFFDFSYFDDNRLIIDRYYSLAQLSNIGEAFKQDMSLLSIGGYYRPLLTISFIIDAQLGGISPIMYHLTNIIIHLVASSLLFILLSRLGYRKGLSFFFSLIFTVHPALTHAVCWIPGRNDSLLAIFIMLSFITLLSFIETRKWKYYALHLFFFTLAVFTKEVSFVFIIVAFLYLHLVVKDKIFSSNKLIFGTGWLIIIILWLVARQSPLGSNTIDKISFAWGDLAAIFIYIGKILLPFNLSVVPILKDSTLIYGFITLMLLIISLFLTKNKRVNFIIFGALWFILFLIPSFINASLSVVSFFMEHRIYLPMIGFFIIVLETDPIKKLDIKNSPAAIFGVLVVIILSTITYLHSLDYKDKYAFWESAVATSPDAPFAHVNLGFAYQSDGKLDLAEKECKRALELNPEQPLAHNILGLIYMGKNMYKEAEKEFEQELAINRAPDKVLPNLGALYYKQGNLKAAEEVWKENIKLTPRDPASHHNLGLLYMDKNMFKEAEEEFKQEFNLDPNSNKAVFNLGMAYYHQGKVKEAEEIWNKVNTKEPLAHNNFGLTLMDKKLYKEAESEFRKELALNPNSTTALFNLGLLYYDQGKLKEAEESWRRIIAINPSESMVHNNLGLLYVKNNMSAQAEEEFKQELAVNPHSSRALFNLGLLYQKQSKLKEMEECWVKAIGVNPDDIGIYKQLILYYKEQKSFTKAKYYIEQLQKKGVQVPPDVLKDIESR